uniref:F-box domain-containing protein n=1 Tax=Aegilops tauschii TaxID=37682 RepID=N1QQ62_AEGTA
MPAFFLGARNRVMKLSSGIPGGGPNSCNSGPFSVACIEDEGCVDDDEHSLLRASVYSSYTQKWTSPACIHIGFLSDNCFMGRPSLLIGKQLYFLLDHGLGILRYDLSRHRLSVMICQKSWLSTTLSLFRGPAVGWGCSSRTSTRFMYSRWSIDGEYRWLYSRAIDLNMLRPIGHPMSSHPPVLAGSLEGTNVSIVVIDLGVFTFDRKSLNYKKLSSKKYIYGWDLAEHIFLYTSFNTIPALAGVVDDQRAAEGGACNSGPFSMACIEDEGCVDDDEHSLLRAFVYSSYTQKWTSPACIHIGFVSDNYFMGRPSLLIGKQLYFLLDHGLGILRAIDLNMLRPIGHPMSTHPPVLAGSLEGTDVTIVVTDLGVFTFDRKSLKFKKLSSKKYIYGWDLAEHILLYTSFNTIPALAGVVDDQRAGEGGGVIMPKSELIPGKAHENPHPHRPLARSMVEELVEKILLSIPPEELEILVRASLACKPWCCLLSGNAFRSRYLALHGTALVLAFLQSWVAGDPESFIPTKKFCPRSPIPKRESTLVLD